MISPVNRLAQRARESRGDHSSVFSIMQYDWPKRKQKYLRHRNRFAARFRRRYFSGERNDRRKYVCVRRLMLARHDFN